ncbi:hypothetical protein DSCO28_41680 [Desulfosarcina ovata subsp. sediminis]|uniref:Sigma-54 factor interaction domain-containing protein n=2 Tax=Desulfosarcina ovata TaxID=83564 RepID=A0A5K7ZTS6_9BACT|nr:hypothetical protein DSCO28_41680 [Desulfosarcina ovata subsp. sediminis]
MRALYAMLTKVARHDLTALITGPSGVGKELAARAIHDLSPRRDRPLVTIHCGAFPENLLESELFGHCKGAFTGATRDRMGRFEQADGGTVFLDEVGELSLALQVKLLRVIQFRTFERLGENKMVRVNVRLIAATHRDLKQGVAEGWFREDLYYRLNVVPIEIPRLKERREDIPLLVDYFLGRHGGGDGRRPVMTPAALAALEKHAFPGNVRELENIVQRALVFADTPLIDTAALPPDVRPNYPETHADIDRPGVDCEALSAALQHAVIRNHDGQPAPWHRRLRCIKLEAIETFLRTWGADWFSRKRYARFLENHGNHHQRGKYKTAGDHLAILRANRICVHNHQKSNRAAYRLHDRFLSWDRVIGSCKSGPCPR